MINFWRLAAKVPEGGYVTDVREKRMQLAPGFVAAFSGGLQKMLT